MSADNWERCPRCWDKALQAYRREESAVAQLYGKIPVDEFDAARSALEPPTAETYHTFREDYSFDGAAQGEVVASYKGQCVTCGLECSFTHAKHFWAVES